MDLEITLRVNGAAHPLWAKSWSSLPVTWQTARASSPRREAARCRLAHNQQLVQQRVLLLMREEAEGTTKRKQYSGPFSIKKEGHGLWLYH